MYEDISSFILNTGFNERQSQLFYALRCHIMRRRSLLIFKIIKISIVNGFDKKRVDLEITRLNQNLFE